MLIGLLSRFGTIDQPPFFSLLASELLHESPQRHPAKAYQLQHPLRISASQKNLSVSNSLTSSAAMGQHSDEVDQLLRAVLPQAPEVLHHVFSLEGKPMRSFLFSKKPDKKPRGQRSPAGIEHCGEQSGIPSTDHCHRTIQGQQSDQPESEVSSNFSATSLPKLHCRTSLMVRTTFDSTSCVQMTYLSRTLTTS